MSEVITIFDPLPPPPSKVKAPVPHAPPAPSAPSPEPAGATAPALDENLRRGIIHTTISPRLAKALTLLFLAGIFIVPPTQLALERLRHQHLQEFDVLRRKPTRENNHEFETKLAENAYIKRLFQPRLQTLLSKHFAFGNTMSILARDGLQPNGWLFSQLGNDYLTGRGFLDPESLRQRKKALFDDGDEFASPDPRPAIIQFHRDCQAAGGHLIFMPIPVKPMIQPAELSSRFDFDGQRTPLNNPDYARFITDLRAAGVDIFDPTPLVLRSDDADRYLAQDTHWTPQWMESVAKDLADHIRTKVSLPPQKQFQMRLNETAVSPVGDIVDPLKLPRNQRLFSPQKVTIHQVLDANANHPRPWRQAADVLFLGDSFSNIYSIDQMG